MGSGYRQETIVSVDFHGASADSRFRQLSEQKTPQSPATGRKFPVRGHRADDAQCPRLNIETAGIIWRGTKDVVEVYADNSVSVQHKAEAIVLADVRSRFFEVRPFNRICDISGLPRADIERNLWGLAAISRISITPDDPAGTLLQLCRDLLNDNFAGAHLAPPFRFAFLSSPIRNRTHA